MSLTGTARQNMKQMPFLTRSFGVLATVSAISLSTAFFLPDHHPINRMTLSFADQDDIDEDIEEDIEAEIEEEIDDALDDEIEDELDDEIDDELEDDLELEIDEEIDESFDEAFEDDFEEDFDDEMDPDFGENFEFEIEDLDAFNDRLNSRERDEEDNDIEDEFEDEIDEDDEFDDDDFDEEDEEDEVDDEQEEDEEEDDDDTSMDSRLDLFDIELDERGDAFAANEFLVLGSADEIDALVNSGLIPEEVTSFDSLDLRLARVSSLGSQTRDEVEALIADIAPNAEIDVNHLYFEQDAPDPADALTAVADHRLSDTAGLSIGMIDTKLDAGHQALQSARLTERDFVRVDRPRPSDHGTAIASLLVGESETFVGLLPNAELFAASVFFETTAGSSSATTDSLVAGLAWLVDADVDVINMSLSGPPNAVLQRAVAQVQGQGKVLVAAVGNDGPMASPRYPAAYEGVIGVTAISEANTAFRLAGRGAHVDFSAPGVSVPHAARGNRYSVSSGTSFAAPYVTASYALTLEMHAADLVYDVLAVTAKDLGQIGFDPIYGHGLIRPPVIYQTATAGSPADRADGTKP